MIEQKGVGGRHAGSFKLPGGREFVGELWLCGRQSKLILGGVKESDIEQERGDITGHLLDGRNVTCLRCIISGARSSRRSDGSEVDLLTLFPHEVAIGSSHISGSVAFRVESLLPEPDVGGTLPGWKLSSHKHWV